MGRTRRLRYRHLRRTIIAVLAMVAAFLVLALVLRMLLTAEPTRRLARQWIEAAAARHELELSIGELSWGFLPLGVRLDDLSLTGPGFAAEIDRASVDLRSFRLMRQTVELGTVAADGVRLRFAELPEQTERRDNRLKVRVRHLQLTRLELEGAGLPGDIDLSLSGMDAGWSSHDGSPTGFVRVDRVGVTVPGLQTIEAAVAARLRIDGVIEIPNWSVDGDGIDLSGSGVIGRTSRTLLRAAGTVDLAELDRIVGAGGVLDGTMTVDAVVAPARDEPLVAELRSRRVDVAGFPIEGAAGRLVLGRDHLRGELDRATMHGGRMSGSYRLVEIGGSFPHRVRINGDGVEVAGILASLRVPPAGISTLMDADVAIDWNGTAFPSGVGRGDAVLQPGDGPLSGSGELTVEMRGDGALTFAADALRLGGSTFSWQGPLAIGSWQPSWSVNADPAVIEEVIPLVNSWVGTRVLPEVEGRGRLQVSLSGPWSELVVNTRLDARPLRLGSAELDHVVTSALIGGSRLTLGPSRFRLGDGTGEFEGSLTWDPEAGSDQLAIDIRGRRIPLDRIDDWIDRDGSAEGALSFTGGLSGPIALPRGSWAAGLTDVAVWGVGLGNASATVDLADTRFEMRGLDFDGGLGGRLWWRVRDNEVGADLHWAVMPLDFLGGTITRTIGDHAKVRLDGRITPEGRLAGRLDAVNDAGRVEVDAGLDRWLVAGQLADAASASVELVPIGDDRLGGVGEVRLESAQRLLEMVLPDTGVPLEGTARFGIVVDWPFDELPSITGEVEELGLRLEDKPIRLLAPAQFDLSTAGLEVRDLYLAHLDDRVFLRWGIDADGTIRGNATGTLDALLLRFLLSEWEPAGRATGVIEMLGSIDDPRFEGIAEIAQGSFRLPGGRMIVSGVNGTVLLSSDELVIDGSDFRFMQGRGVADGRISSRDGTFELDLAGDVDGLRYEVFPGLVARVSGQWRLNGPVDDLFLGGELRVDRTTLQRRDVPTALIVDWFGGADEPPEQGGINLDLQVEADQTIEIRNPFVRLDGSGSVRITGTTAQPGLVGKIEFDEGGEVTMQNLRYELERGSFTFADPEVIDPVVELQLRTWVQNYQVTLRVTGTSDRLVPQVTSNPPLPQEEVYALLAMGYRGQSNLGSGAMGLGVASSLLSQQIASELDRRTNLVLPHVRVDPFAETSSGGPAARVTVVQQLAPNWTVTLQSNLSAERAEVVVSRWYLAPGLFVEASRELDGSYGVDLKLRRPY